MATPIAASRRVEALLSQLGFTGHINVESSRQGLGSPLFPGYMRTIVTSGGPGTWGPTVSARLKTALRRLHGVQHVFVPPSGRRAEVYWEPVDLR